MAERGARLEREVARLSAKLEELVPEEAEKWEESGPERELAEAEMGSGFGIPEETVASPERPILVPPLPVRFGGEPVFHETPEVAHHGDTGGTERGVCF